MMPVGEVFLRSLVCGSVIGLTSYLVGTAHHAGRRLSTSLVRAVGGVAGFLGGFALVAGFAPWFLVVIVSLLMAILVAVLLVAVLSTQDRFSEYVGKRRRKD